MKQKTPSKVKKKAIVIIALIMILIIIGALLVLWLLKKNMQGQENGLWDELTLQETGAELEGDIVYASGVVSIGTSETEFPIDGLTNQLTVEEVYISSGDTIEEGTVLFKFTEESVETVRTELEETLRAADLAYRAGYIEYQQSLITAYYDKESTLVSGTQAQAVYEETVAGLADNVERAKEELDLAKEQIAEYEDAINNNTYYAEVEYYKAIYDENLELLKQRMGEWDVSWSEVTSGSSSGGSNMGAGSMEESAMNGSSMGDVMVQSTSVSGGDAGSTDLHSQYVTVLSNLYKVLEQNGKDYEQALADYEDAVENASFELQTLKLQLSSLEESYAQAQENYETSLLQADLTRETSLSNAQKAEANYEDNVEKAESDYEQLQEAKEEAEENLALFQELIKDCCYYARESGSVLRMSVRAGGELGSGSRLYTLSDAQELTVTVSVSQENIASLTIGDSAMVQSLEDSSMYNGTITAIYPIAALDSKASITYSVTVTLGERADGLSNNESVVVYFGMGKVGKNNE